MHEEKKYMNEGGGGGVGGFWSHVYFIKEINH
jgi:hypothetical protein